MKKILLAGLAILCFQLAESQVQALTREPYGGNKKASVSEQIGIVVIQVSYNRPGVKGREGKIWGTSIAHYGFKDQGHGTSYAAPWRAGANENTTIEFSHPVTIEGQPLNAGKYGFFIALGETESTLIFNKVNNSWGSFYYDSTQDALRVKIKNKQINGMQERLQFSFGDQTDSSAVLSLAWEHRSFPFRIEAKTKELQMASFRSELRTTRSFYDFLTAAFYCLEKNYELDQALAWVDRAAYFRVMGVKNWLTLSTRARILYRLGRKAEASKAIDEALPYGNAYDISSYADFMQSAGEEAEALRLYRINYEKHSDDPRAILGMGIVEKAKGNRKKAQAHFGKVLSATTEEALKKRAEELGQSVQ